MTAPVLRQWRDSIVLVDGTTQLVVTARLVNAGTGSEALPCTEVFVLSITDPLNPKSDVFARIATPIDLRKSTNNDFYVKVSSSDMQVISGDTFARVANAGEVTSLGRSRDEALRRGQTEYLSPVCSFVYADLPTANAAFQTIIERVSTLATDWYSYNSTFMLPTYQDYNIPVSSIGIRTTTQAAYYAARDVRVAAEAALATITVTKANAELKLAYDRQLLGFLDEAVTRMSTGLTTINEKNEAATATLMPSWSVPPTPANGYSIIVTQTAIAKTWALNGGDPASFQSVYAWLLGLLNAQRVTVTAQVATVATVTQQYTASELAVEAARTTEEAALAAARTACPIFTPTT